MKNLAYLPLFIAIGWLVFDFDWEPALCLVSIAVGLFGPDQFEKDRKPDHTKKDREDDRRSKALLLRSVVVSVLAFAFWISINVFRSQGDAGDLDYARAGAPVLGKPKNTDKDTAAVLPGNYEITVNSIGGLYIGMSLDSIAHFYNAANGYKITSYSGTFESCDYDEIFIQGPDSNMLLSIIPDQNGKIHSIRAYGERFKTYNGLRPGLTMSEYCTIYPGDKKIFQGEIWHEEWFEPYDMQTLNSAFQVYFERTDGKKDEDPGVVGVYTGSEDESTKFRTKNVKVGSIGVSADDKTRRYAENEPQGEDSGLISARQ